MRLSEPPEKVLKKSSTPPCVCSESRPSAVGSTPGSGTKLNMRKTMSTPSVNHRRFFSSVAFEKLARLILDRKSVVEGKRVSVLVDRGGRRIIKKKIDGYIKHLKLK